MIYPINKIYTEVKNSVASLCKNTSRTFKSTTKTLPFLYFKVLGNPSTFNDLDNNENAIILTIEILRNTYEHYNKRRKHLQQIKFLLKFPQIWETML